MKSVSKIGLAAALLLGLGNALARNAAAQTPGSLGFTLQDFLGRKWRNETVQFPCSPAQLALLKQGQTVVGPDNKPVASQIVEAAPGKPAKVAFQTDLQPFEKRTYRLAPGPAKTAPTAVTDLKIEEDADTVRLSNSLTGIAIAKRLAAGAGPIQGIRLNSGAWAGASRLASSQAIRAYAVKVESRGPVFAEVTCRAQFDEGHNWMLRFRLEAHEPVVLVDEQYSLGDNSYFHVSFTPGFNPDNVFYRYGRTSPGESNVEGKLATWKIAPDAEPAFMLEPWLHWWERRRQNPWFGLYAEAGTDMLAVGTRDPGVWVDPAKRNFDNQKIAVRMEGTDLQAHMPLQGGARRWMIGAFQKNEVLSILTEKNLFQAPLPQQYFIKHGEFPLDRIKDYALQWTGDDNDHPRMLVTKPQVAKFRAGFRADPKVLAALRTTPVDQYHLDQPIQYYLGTGDAELGRHLAVTALQWVQDAVDMFTQQDAQVTIGFAPHHQTQILTALNLADAVWSTALTPQERARIKAQVAFLGYTVNTPGYWSPERGFSANANMTTTVAAFKSAIAGAIPSHPRSAEWMKAGMTEFKDNQLENWADANGGWLEAPHYAMVSYDYIVGLFLMAHNAGLNDYLYDPKMKKIMEWFAKISTPPDSRYLGRRHSPAIGNTLLSEPSGEYGILAALWKDKAPEFAANMQWMFRQQGSPAEPGIGGFFPTLAGYRQMLIDPSIVEKAPSYKSELFPRTGLVLRNHFPSDRETQLHMIAGDHHSHYDKDSGSVTLWGKGRILADDFGYEGYMPGEDHNMVVAPLAKDEPIMGVTEFTPGEALDYASGEKQGWQRQLALVKEADPLGGNYFVIRDTMQVPTQATWRMWFTAAAVTPNAHGATVTGKDDIDTDVFFAGSESTTLTTEDKTRTPIGGNSPDGTYGLPSQVQTGLIATQQRGSGFFTVLYPRLKTEKPPVMTSLADGKAVKIEGTFGTDYVFLSDVPFTYQEGDIRFEGTVGLVQIRAGKARLSLGAGGSIAALGQSLKKEATAGQPPLRKRNPIANGDFEADVPLALSSPQETFVHAKVEDSPAVASNAGAPRGKRSLAVTFDKDGATYFGVQQALYVDPARVYKASFKIYSESKVHVAAGGYASDLDNRQLKRDDGQVWQFTLAGDGPTTGWQTVETTIGPPVSNANYKWPEGIVFTGFGFWVTAQKGKLFLDDLTLQAVDNPK